MIESEEKKNEVVEIDLGMKKLVMERPVENDKMYSDIFSMVKRVENEPAINYIWSGIKRGTFGYIFGPAKSGKTILAENLAMSIAAKRTEFLGMPIDTTGIERVMFISLEEFWKNRCERNRKQLSVLKDINFDNFKYTVVNETFPLTMEFDEDWAKMSNIITESKSQLVIIDSLTRLTWDEVEKSKIGSVLSRKLRNLTNDLDITMIVIHHSAKLIDSCLDLANMAGSRVIGQEADFILGVNNLSNRTRYFKEVSMRYKQADECVTTFKINDNLWLEEQSYVEETALFGPVDHRENPSNERMVFDSVKRLSKNSDSVKTSEVLADLEGKIGKTTLYGYFENLEEKGMIDRSKKSYLKIIK